MSQSPTETLLCHPGCFDIETLSPLQRAICRVKDGVEAAVFSKPPRDRISR